MSPIHEPEHHKPEKMADAYRVAWDEYFVPRHELEARLTSVERDAWWMKRAGAFAMALASALLGTGVTALVRFWPGGGS